MPGGSAPIDPQTDTTTTPNPDLNPVFTVPQLH